MTLKRAVVANFLGQGWTAVSGFVFVPWYIHLLGVEAYGVIGFFAVLQASLSLFDLGMTPTVSRQLARYSSGTLGAQEAVSLVRAMTLVSFSIGLIIILVLVMLAPFFSTSWFKDAPFPADQLKIAFYGIAVVVGLRFCEGLLRGALIGLERQIVLNVLLIIFATVRNGGVILAMIWAGSTLAVFFAYQAILSVLVLATFAYTVHRSLPQIRSWTFSIAPLLDSLGFSAGMFVISAASLIITQADKIILSRTVPLATYSPYMLAVTLAGALPLVVGPIAQAVYPRLVRYIDHNEEAGLSGLYHLASQSVAVLILPIIVMTIAFPEQIIFGWSGNAPLAMSMIVILPLVVAGTGANALYWLPYYAQLAMGWTRLLARYNVACAVLVVLALLVFAKKYGVTAGGTIWLLLNLSYIIILVPIVHRRFLIGQATRWYLGTIALPLLAAGLTAVGIRLLAPVPTARFFVIVFLIGAYAAAAVAAAFAAPDLRRTLMLEGHRLLRRRTEPRSTASS